MTVHKAALIHAANRVFGLLEGRNELARTSLAT